jgi:hypothetical protein
LLGVAVTVYHPPAWASVVVPRGSGAAAEPGDGHSSNPHNIRLDTGSPHETSPAATLQGHRMSGLRSVMRVAPKGVTSKEYRRPLSPTSSAGTTKQGKNLTHCTYPDKSPSFARTLTCGMPVPVRESGLRSVAGIPSFRGGRQITPPQDVEVALFVPDGQPRSP